jgi:hypothetical protein
VFGSPPNGPDLARAIASYERTQFSFDRHPITSSLGTTTQSAIPLTKKDTDIASFKTPDPAQRAHHGAVLSRRFAGAVTTA